MEKLKGLFYFLVIIPMLLITSCGYVSDKPVANIGLYKIDELQQVCTIDVSKLSEIFKEDQRDQIRCLQENFIQFTKYVRAKQPGSVSEDELGIFVKRFFQGQSEAIINGLSLIFQLNMILLKDEADRISNTKISPLFELLVKVNQEAVILTNIIKLMDIPANQGKFWELREKFNEATNRFANSAIGIIESSPGIAKKLNMNQFIIDMATKIGDSSIDTKTIDSFIFLKKAIVAGDREIITTDELKNVLVKLPKILGLIFDAYYIKGENFKQPSEEIKFYLLALRETHQLLRFDQPNFELLTSEQLVSIAKRFFKDHNIESFKTSIEALKARFIGGDKDSLTLNDLDVFFGILVDFFEKVYFNYITYDDPATTALLIKPVMLEARDLTFKKLSGYNIFSDPKRVNDLFASFTDTVINFRYFREKTSGSAFYDTQIVRTKNGLNEVNISKWLGAKLLKAYGHLDDKGQMQISMDEFSKFLIDSKPLLQELKLWSPNFTTFSRNSVLLADLFQPQSNGDQNISLNESTEYIGMLLTAVEVSGKFSTELTRVCDAGINKDDPLFEINCFNENFYDLVLNKLNYKKSLPRLAKYYANSSKKETQEYLKGVEGFARDSNEPGVPVNGRDSTLILGALINIETTFIRFDKNRDNIIDYNELSEAFFTYRTSIISLAGLRPEQEKYAKGVFLYMVSKMKIPKTGTWTNDIAFGSFNSCVQSDLCRGFMDKIEAKRLNIGKLLFYLVNQASVAPNKLNRPRAATISE